MCSQFTQPPSQRGCFHDPYLQEAHRVLCGVGIIFGLLVMAVSLSQSVGSIGFTASLLAGGCVILISIGGYVLPVMLWYPKRSNIEESSEKGDEDKQLLQENLFQAVRKAAEEKKTDGELASELDGVDLSSRDYEQEAIGAIKAFIELGAKIHQPEKRSNKTLIDLAEELNLMKIANYLRSVN